MDGPLLCKGRHQLETVGERPYLGEHGLSVATKRADFPSYGRYHI